MSAKWDKPEETLKLLDELEKFGFNDDAFWRLHHWRERRTGGAQPSKPTAPTVRNTKYFEPARTR